jgi:hypothetical protein
VLVSRLATMPRTLWESDEHLFVAAVKKFEPLASHPHPPGYPLYIGLGKFVTAFTGNIFGSLVGISIASCVIGVIALSLLLRRIIGDPDLAVCGALLYYFGAAMLVHATTPMSDASGIACALLALLSMTYFPSEATERTAIFAGIATSAAIGIRPQFAVPLLPVFVYALLTTREARKVAAGILSFFFLSLAWFTQLVEACKGWDTFLAWETRQAAYIAAHDAALSRGASSLREVAARFLFHPWGPKAIALPVIFLALLGAVAFVRSVPVDGKRRAIAPIAFTAIYFFFALEIMDPADGPRYALPWLIAVALFAALGLGTVRDSLRMKYSPYAIVATIALGTFVFVAPIIVTRRREPSPAAAAAACAITTYPANSVILYDLSMRPQAELLFSRFAVTPLDQGMAAYYDRPDVPLIALGDGGSFAAGAKTFSWPETDAYDGLTRGHYRVVSLETFAANERFFPLRGIYPTERTSQFQWRWLQPDAAFRLPRGHGHTLILTFGLSHDLPYETTDARAVINGVPGPSVTIAHNGRARLVAPLPETPEVEVVILSSRSFVPATVLHNQDQRILAVQLLHVETH